MTVPDSWYLDPRHAPVLRPGDPGTIHVALDRAITHLRAGERLSADHLLQLLDLGLDDGDPT